MTSVAAASTVEGPAQAGPIDSARSTYGLVEIRGAAYAIGLSTLKEVVPAPRKYDALPFTHDLLRGAMTVRSRMIPVIDIGADDRPPPGPSGAELAGRADGGEELVAVIEHDGRAVGLVAERVLGVESVAADLFQDIHVTAGGDSRVLFRHCYVDPARDTLIYVLSAADVFTLPGIPVVDATAATAHRTVGGTVGDDHVSLMLVDVGDVSVAIDVTTISTVLPQCDLEPSVLTGPGCLGVTLHGGLRIPVADLLHTIGIGTVPPGGLRQGLVLELPRGYVALAVSEVREIVRTSRADMIGAPTFGSLRHDLVSGLWTPPHGRTHLVLDPEGLRADPDLDVLAALNVSAHEQPVERSTGRAAATDGGAERAGQRYVACRFGVDAAVPMEQIEQILSLPSPILPLGTDHPAHLGCFVHRGEATPLVHLGTVFDGLPREHDPEARVLLVRARGVAYGLIVDRLVSVTTSTWEEEPEAVRPWVNCTEYLASRPLIRLDAGFDDRHVPRIDLCDVLTAFVDPPAGGGAPWLTGGEPGGAWDGEAAAVADDPEVSVRSSR